MKLSLKLLVLLLSASFCVQASAATFTVNNTGDNGGVDPAPGAGTGTLRQAIVDANANPGADTITFTVTGTILLASYVGTIEDDVDISGPGANALTVKRDPSADAFGIFAVRDGKTVAISGLTITNGSGAFGAGIFNGGTLTVTDCTISGNSATDSEGSGVAAGGGIFTFGTLTVTNCAISGNSATTAFGNAFGGGIANDTGPLTVTNSTISGNSAYGNSAVGDGGRSFGGGFRNFTGTVTFTNSTISGNSATTFDGSAFGGGIANDTGPLTFTNSTISGNSASSALQEGSGGGVYNSGTVTFTNSTISGNSASNVGGVLGASFGGGIDNQGTLNLNTSIVGNNDSFFVDIGPAEGPDIWGAASGDYNLVEDTSDTTLTGTNNITGVDPMLGPLQPNGGPTFTHELMAGSPAIDKGKNMDSLTTDQRGTGFARTVDNPSIANATGGDGTDIGAFEVQATSTPTPTPVSQITVDGTKCDKFSNGTATTLDTVTYKVDGHGKTKDVKPPKFMYWVKVTAAAGSNMFAISQSITTGNFNTQFKLDGGGNVFKGSDCKPAMGVNMSQNTTNGTNSLVTVRFNAQQAGIYYIAVKLQTGNVGGDPAPAPSTTVHYDFATTGVPGSTSSVDLVKQ